MSRGWELAKIGIDVASYFLVTIDLYGEDRVERLTKWLAQRMTF